MRPSIKFLATTFLALSFFLTAKAQTNLAYNNCELKPIGIGEKIPDQIWNKAFPIINYPGSKGFMKLNEFGNKLIILDFWATWCKPCVASLDYLDSIKTEFKDNLVVVPVLINDKIENAPEFIKKKGYIWPCIVGDTVMSKTLYRETLIGFGTMWIKDGKLLAVPSKKSFTADNIRKIIQNQPVTFIPIKKRR